MSILEVLASLNNIHGMRIFCSNEQNSDMFGFTSSQLIIDIDIESAAYFNSSMNQLNELVNALDNSDSAYKLTINIVG